MTDSENIDTPNEKLAKEIIDSLLEAGLIKEENKSALESKLKDEGVNQDDWELLVDINSEPEVTGEADE